MGGSILRGWQRASFHQQSAGHQDTRLTLSRPSRSAPLTAALRSPWLPRSLRMVVCSPRVVIIAIWDMATKQEVVQLPRHTDTMNCLQVPFRPIMEGLVSATRAVQLARPSLYCAGCQWQPRCRPSGLCSCRQHSGPIAHVGALSYITILLLLGHIEPCLSGSLALC